MTVPLATLLPINVTLGIFVLAYRPGVEPNEADKSVARSRIEELITKAHENSKQQDLPPVEIEAAIDEAIQIADE